MMEPTLSGLMWGMTAFVPRIVPLPLTSVFGGRLFNGADVRHGGVVDQELSSGVIRWGTRIASVDEPVKAVSTHARQVSKTRSGRVDIRFCE